MDGKKPQKKRTVMDYLLTLVLVVSIGVFCYAGYHLIVIWGEYKKGTEEYKELAEAAVTLREEVNEIEITEAEDIKTEEIKKEDVQIKDIKTEEIVKVLDILEEIVLEEVKSEIQTETSKESFYKPVSEAAYNEKKEAVYEEEKPVVEKADKKIEEAVIYEKNPVDEAADREREKKLYEVLINEGENEDIKTVKNKIEDETEKNKNCVGRKRRSFGKK